MSLAPLPLGAARPRPTLRYSAAQVLDPEIGVLAAQGVAFVAAVHGRWRFPVHHASADLDVLVSQAERWPETDWLAATTRSDAALLVIDKSADLGAMEAVYGPLVPTVTSLSPRGSSHRWYRAQGLASHVFAPGVVLRQGARAMVAVPPSEHSEGGCYAWVPGNAPSEIAIATLPPAWALAAALPAGRA